MSSSESEAADLLPGAPLSRAAQLTRRVLWLYAAFAATLILLISLSALPAKGGLLKLRSMGFDAAASGLGVVALAMVLVTLAAFAATAVLTESRIWVRRREAAASEDPGESEPAPPSLLDRLWRLGPGVLGRQGQAVILTLAAVAVLLLARFMWPRFNGPPLVGADANLAAALVIALAFPSLIAERTMFAFPSGQLPEARGLRRLLLISTVLLAATGAIEIGQGAGLKWLVWAQCALLVAICLVALELCLRALARLFLPPPPVESAKAAVESLLAALVTGGAGAPGNLIRTHLGLDFARSWALTYLKAAMIPAVVGTLLLCWFLTGLKLLGDDQRGIYERLGAPVGVLGPGLHVLLPWPLGRLRPVEYGTIHTLAVGVDAPPDSSDKIGAEAEPTPGMDRLWTTAHATEAHYLVASESEGQGQGQQEFQAVSSEILVLYRTGLTQAAAWQSVYGASNQQAIVKEEADRLVTRYFSSHTLDDVIGAQRQSLEDALRAELAQAVQADHAGIDIVEVLIEEIHPPAGAAAAYHAVQAAKIDSDAKVADATAHAERTRGEAQEEAQQALDSAQAASVEKIQAATADAYLFDADRHAYRLSPESMLLERRDRNLITALKGARVTIMDSGLSGAQGPLIDMRSGAGARNIAAVAAAGSSSGVNPVPMSQPDSSTELPPPPLTNEEAAEQAAHPGQPE
jgi:regulator of protease activity HflC (stomatin/prohibitin superfamily)